MHRAPLAVPYPYESTLRCRRRACSRSLLRLVLPVLLVLSLLLPRVAVSRWALLRLRRCLRCLRRRRRRRRRALLSLLLSLSLPLLLLRLLCLRLRRRRRDRLRLESSESEESWPLPLDSDMAPVSKPLSLPLLLIDQLRLFLRLLRLVRRDWWRLLIRLHTLTSLQSSTCTCTYYRHRRRVRRGNHWTGVNVDLYDYTRHRTIDGLTSGSGDSDSFGNISRSSIALFS